MAFYISGPKLLFETTEISTHPNSTQQESNYIYLYTTKFGTSIKIRLNRVRDNGRKLYFIFLNNDANQMDKRGILTSSRFFNKYCVAFSLTVGRRWFSDKVKLTLDSGTRWCCTENTIWFIKSSIKCLVCSDSALFSKSSILLSTDLGYLKKKNG